MQEKEGKRAHLEEEMKADDSADKSKGKPVEGEEEESDRSKRSRGKEAVAVLAMTARGRGKLSCVQGEGKISGRSGRVGEKVSNSKLIIIR